MIITTYLLQIAGLSLELSDRSLAAFREKFWSKVYIFLYILYILISPSAQNSEKWAGLGNLFSQIALYILDDISHFPGDTVS